MYSQRDEEEVILRATKDWNPYQSRFLDIGAFTGRHLSNTLALAERGWRGVLVEPSPWAFKQLWNEYGEQQERSESPDDKWYLLEAALVPAPLPEDFIVLHEAKGDGISTTSEAHRKVWAAVVTYEPVQVTWVTWRQLLAFAGDRFDFLNLDVEGTNTANLLAMPDSLWESLRLICVEKDTPDQRAPLLALFEKKGWKLIHETHENLLCVKG